MYEERGMSSLQARLFSREVLPFQLSPLALAAAAWLCDAALHLLNAVCQRQQAGSADSEVDAVRPCFRFIDP
jgi:hypothetical protein